MPARKKTICLNEDEYRRLVKARGKYEHETGQRTGGFGQFVAFVMGLYLLDKSLKGKNSQAKR